MAKADTRRPDRYLPATAAFPKLGKSIDAPGLLLLQCTVAPRPDVEELEPDYDLYPELGDRAIGFFTRGCPGKCPFCLVPEKEGKPRQVSDLDGLLQGERKKLILLDDNILSYPQADRFLKQMADGKIRVNFTQTLDFRMIDKGRAELLRRVRCENTRFTRPNYYFSVNDDENLDRIAEKYALFGFVPKDNVEFVCMYGFNTTLAHIANMPPSRSQGMPDQDGLVTIDTHFPTNPR